MSRPFSLLFFFYFFLCFTSKNDGERGTVKVTAKNNGKMFVVVNNSKEIVGTIKREAGGVFAVSDKRTRDNPDPFALLSDAIEYFCGFDWDGLGCSSLHMPQSRSINKITGRKQRWSLS